MSTRTEILKRTVLAERYRLLHAKQDIYARQVAPIAVERIQLARLNDIWSYCLASVPFYQSWQKEHDLPRRFRTTAELADFPPMTRATIVERSDEIFQHGSITDAYTTGGSTGEPARYPRSADELKFNWADAYVGRGWWGVAPGDANVHLWGHAHLFGQGARGRLAEKRRELNDCLLSIRRLNAYDLSEEALLDHFSALQRTQPRSLSGYTSALFRLARFMEQNDLRLSEDSRLKVVVACAETVSDADVQLLERVFRAPVAIEYGAAESGVIAMSRGVTRRIQVLWESMITSVSDTGDLHLTTLDPRLFPLVNYSIGDKVAPLRNGTGSVLEFKAIMGRAQDVVRVGCPGGSIELSAILPVHILKAYPGVVAVQFDQKRDDLLRVYIESRTLSDLEDLRQYFLRELRRDHPQVDGASIEFVPSASSHSTRSGKHSLFVR